MLCAAKCLRSVIIAGLIAGGLVLASPAVQADSPISGGSVTITAVIAPVRIVVVNNRGKILEIQSNTPDDVTPSVYTNKINTKPVALTPAIYSQYTAIMQHANLHKAGVIYKFNNSTTNKLAGWISLNSYRSILPHTRMP